MTTGFTDADAAELYDLLNPWDAARFPADAFYDRLVAAADSVLDVGCGTGAMLHRARELGHTGRLVGIDPDPPSLARARRRGDVEWIAGTAADAAWRGEFALATMVGHAFQCLLDDDEVHASLVAVHAALRGGGRFVFETRDPRARAWEDWNPAHARDVTGPGGRPLRVWHEVDSVDGELVAFSTTTAAPDGLVLHRDRSTLRFLGEAALDARLAAAGFTVEARYGDWDGSPVTAAGRELITVARRS